jgi:hypothetical protein
MKAITPKEKIENGALGERFLNSLPYKNIVMKPNIVINKPICDK